MSANLYGEVKQELWDHMAAEHNSYLLESEEFELWQVATRSCRKEIQRLERLLKFQTDGRVKDAEERNQVIQELQCATSAKSTTRPTANPATGNQ